MQYHDVDFVTSAIKKEQFPDSTLPEFLLVGRSNVGKSTLINTLVNRKNLAYVGSKPGKTRLLNFYEVDHRLMMVDAPGYGFANRSKQELIVFSNMMDDYFSSRKQLKVMIQIVDLRHKPTRDDVDMIEFARSYNLKTIVVATKYDKVKNSERAKNVKQILQTLNISEKSLVLFSSENFYGLEKLWGIINENMVE